MSLRSKRQHRSIVTILASTLAISAMALLAGCGGASSSRQGATAGTVAIAPHASDDESSVTSDTPQAGSTTTRAPGSGTRSGGCAEASTLGAVLGRPVTYEKTAVKQGMTVCSYNTVLEGPENAEFGVIYAPATTEAQFKATPYYGDWGPPNGAERWANGTEYIVFSDNGNLSESELAAMLDAVMRGA